MSFTGLYFELKYYNILNIVFLYKKGTYDYYDGHEEKCTVKSKSIFIKWCWSIKSAKKLVNDLNKTIKKDNLIMLHRGGLVTFRRTRVVRFHYVTKP